jgi:transcription-repair coupling factor (superfamily II helicase)
MGRGAKAAVLERHEAQDPLSPPLPGPGKELATPPEGLLAVWLAGWAGPGRTLVHVGRSEARMRRLARAVAGIRPDLDLVTIPAWDCLPYDRASPSRAAMGQRMAAFRRLANPARQVRLVLTVAEAVLQRMPPRSAVRDAVWRLEVAQRLDFAGFQAFLLGTGYVVDDRVDEPGEAAFRGTVVDLFPAASPEPFRLELDGDVVAAIRRYDPLSQRSIAEVDTLLVEPASELLLPAEEPALERPEWLSRVLDEKTGHRRAGSEQLLPLAYDGLETLADYLPDGHYLLDAEHTDHSEGFLETVQEAFETRRSLARVTAEIGSPLEPAQLHLRPGEWEERTGRRPVVQLGAPDGGPALPRLSPGRPYLQLLSERLAAGDRVVVAGEGGRRLVQAIERETGAAPVKAPGWPEACSVGPGKVALSSTELPAGFTVPGLTVLTAGDLLGRRVSANPSGPAQAAFQPAAFRQGDRVVHADHGVAVLRSLDKVEQDGVAGDYLALEFAGEDRMLVPASSMDRLWRYGSAESDVSLDRLESDAWRKRRAEVETGLAETAGALAALAQERVRVEAPACKATGGQFARFVGRFPFPLTEDQAQAIDATLADLARGSPPMDRLVCGDVGYGKTEVALRAAAVAAMAGRQVAVLAPTTILVRQHLHTFRRRFAGLPFRIEQLSRLARTGEARAVREGLADGSVRIVIGTHALASPEVKFKELGLVVIDEEQRFGTRQKAALRRLRSGVHVLTMTATPIPRTLGGALAGIQDLSVIATPPVRRQPVRTYLLPFDSTVVREATLRERARGGRSFFVCPRIADIGPMAQQLREIVPELDIISAHGRMKAEALDEGVLAFAEGAHDVLLATAIIETGLDIPGADTIIVWRPESFGMAQLHQLRGRVGRGRERGAAYLLHDPAQKLPAATERRLRALETFEGLGAGFAIASQDLDLRGAGDLVGEDQAGHVRLIGTELYRHLLERAFRQARGERMEEDWSPELELGTGYILPADYVPEPELRLDLYARLARLGSEGEADELAEEIADRFGAPPPPAQELMDMARLRLRCRELGVARLDAGPKAVAATFHDPAAAARRYANAADPLAWNGERLVYRRETSSPAERIAAAAALLDRMVRPRKPAPG